MLQQCAKLASELRSAVNVNDSDAFGSASPFVSFFQKSAPDRGVEVVVILPFLSDLPSIFIAFSVFFPRRRVARSERRERSGSRPPRTRELPVFILFLSPPVVNWARFDFFLFSVSFFPWESARFANSEKFVVGAPSKFAQSIFLYVGDRRRSKRRFSPTGRVSTFARFRSDGAFVDGARSLSPRT
jgi:hypothetical protein